MCEFCKKINKPDSPSIFGGGKSFLAEGQYTVLRCGRDGEGRPFLDAVGEDVSEPYYIKFCPLCGKKLEKKLVCDETKEAKKAAKKTKKKKKTA